MILWLDGGHGARLNMDRDAALLEACAGGRLEAPVLRLFQFRPAGITLGASQVPERELDLDRVTADGLEWALRPTGGRAIYHDEEWTFSLVTPLGPPPAWAPDPAAAYARTCGLLATALEDLGVPARTAPGALREAGWPRAPGVAAPCFASTARHEVLLAGRKLAGIAQRRSGGVLLQQGSLLLGDSHLRLVRYQPLAPEARPAAAAALAGAAAHAGAHLGARAPLSRFADALAGRLPGVRRLEGEAAAAAWGLPAPDSAPRSG